MTNHPLITQLQKLMQADPRSPGKILDKAGIGRTTYYQWEIRRRQPGLFIFEWLLNTLGYKLTITRIDEGKQNEIITASNRVADDSQN